MGRPFLTVTPKAIGEKLGFKMLKSFVELKKSQLYW